MYIHVHANVPLERLNYSKNYSKQVFLMVYVHVCCAYMYIDHPACLVLVPTHTVRNVDVDVHVQYMSFHRVQYVHVNVLYVRI